MKEKLLYLFILLYAMAVALAIHLTERHTNGLPETAEAEDSIRVSHPDNAGMDIHLLITEQPTLKETAKETADTLRPLPKRYSGALRMKDENGNTNISTELLLRTDRIGEFANRFNGDSATLAQFDGKLDFTAGGRISSREGHILSLINLTDAVSVSVLQRFAKDMTSRQLFIDTEHGGNYAIVTTFAYTDPNENIFPVRLTFRQSEAKHAPVWYITEAESPYLTFGDDGKPYYIDHAEREIGFMGLSRHTDRSAASIAGPDFQGDPLSAFLTLASKRFIRYRHSENTQLVFRLGEYMFLVEKIESFEHRRSGYLITRILKNGKLIFENRPI